MPRQKKPVEVKKPKWKIPFSAEDGRLLVGRYEWNGSQRYNYKTGKYETLDIVWKEADYEFDAVLEFQNFYRGSSTHHIQFRDINTNEEYTMFSSDFFDMIKLITMHNGIVKGRFGFAKKGNSYCVQFRKQQKEEDQ